MKMITTLTMNPALDKTVFLSCFSINAVNRIKKVRLDAGGKGINVSKIVKMLGEETKVIGCLGGQVGKQLEQMVGQLGISHEFVWHKGETRINTKIVDMERGTCTDLNESGSELTAEELEDIKEVIYKWANQSEVFVVGGGVQPNVPLTFYKEIIENIDQTKCKVLLDASGPLLREGIKAKPWLIKPNIHELEELVSKELTSVELVIKESRKIIDSGVGCVAVSMGQDGILFVTKDRAIQGKPPKVETKSTVGAGDSTVGAMAVGFYRHQSIEEIVKIAVAAGTAAVTMEGTNVPAKELIEELAQKVKILPMSTFNKSGIL